MKNLLIVDYFLASYHPNDPRVVQNPPRHLPFVAGNYDPSAKKPTPAATPPPASAPTTTAQPTAPKPSARSSWF